MQKNHRPSNPKTFVYKKILTMQTKQKGINTTLPLSPDTIYLSVYSSLTG